jgi:7-carboxy-7-deazaguanine synthase
MSRTLAIHETFFSIQGESTHAGRPCSFVRLMGCPLRCSYCDTEYAFYEGKKHGFDEVFQTLEGYGCKLVEVTGGEPLAQPNVIPFMSELVERGYEVLLETSGAFPISDVPHAVKIILDVKTPASNEVKRMKWDNLELLKSGLDEVKFVICSRADFDWACQVAQDHDLFSRVTVLASPSFNQVSYKDLADWVLASKLPWRFQVQMHKHIWAPETRGV